MESTTIKRNAEQMRFASCAIQELIVIKDLHRKMQSKMTDFASVSEIYHRGDCILAYQTAKKMLKDDKYIQSRKEDEMTDEDFNISSSMAIQALWAQYTDMANEMEQRLKNIRRFQLML